MSLTSNYPTTRASLLLDFARSRALDPRITFTRTTAATRTNPYGLVETVAADVPRFEFDPVTLESRGLLIEEQRTNLLTYSNDFSNAIWTPVNSFPVRTQNLTGPDGVANSAWTIDDQFTGSDGAALEQTISLTPSASTQYTCSFWARQGTAAFFDFLMFFTGVSVKGSGIRYVWASNTLSAFSADGGDQASLSLTNAALSISAIAIAYKANDFAASLNGASALTDTSGDLPTSAEITALCIGSFNSTGRFNGTIAKIAYYPFRNSNAQLQSLSLT